MKRRKKCSCGHWKKLLGNEYVCPNCKEVTERLRDTYYNDDDYWDNYDRCYECTGYGDDYYLNDDGELVSACDDCPYNDSYDPWDD